MRPINIYQRAELERIVTGRAESCFAEDFNDSQASLKEAFSRCTVVVFGGAGSIGSAVTKALLNFDPKEVHVFDINENALAELARDIRCTYTSNTKLSFIPIGIEAVSTRHILDSMAHIDFIFNLSALKHVRSEKCIHSLRRMMDTNFLFLDDMLTYLSNRKISRFFSVSSDKAVNPANFMGATKNLMEQVLMLHSERTPFSSARFANVAFSNGSLLDGLLNRLSKSQPITGPNDVSRYFISHEEAAQLCLLAGAASKPSTTLIPGKKSHLESQNFVDIVVRVLEFLEIEPLICDSENDARDKVKFLSKSEPWPCFFSSSDTSGEKVCEEFYSSDETSSIISQFNTIDSISLKLNEDQKRKLEAVLKFFRESRSVPQMTILDYLQVFRTVVPTFKHVMGNRSLDEKM